MSGHVSFKAGERYLPTVNIVQHFDNNKQVTVGQFIPEGPGQRMCEEYEGCLELNESLIRWPGNTKPTDGRQGSPRNTFILFSLFIVLSLMSL